MKSDKVDSGILYSDVDALLFMLEKLYGAKRDDLAFKLLKRFGNLHGIFAASYDELLTVKGITKRVASFFSVVRPIERQALLRRKRDTIVRSEADAVEFAAMYFVHQPPPLDAVAYLTDDNKVAYVENVQSYFDTREVISGLCRHCSKKFLWIRKLSRILPYPTRYELKRLDCMIKILRTAELMNAKLLDYVTIVGSKFLGIRGSYSLRNASEASTAAYPKDQSVTERFVLARELFVTGYDKSED